MYGIGSEPFTKTKLREVAKEMLDNKAEEERAMSLCIEGITCHLLKSLKAIPAEVYTMCMENRINH